MTRCLLLLLVIVGQSFFNYLHAQVVNNNIQNRFALDLNAEPILSSTSKSTVEWKCINKALTNRCLVYHNDQWFDFSVAVAGRYFINVSAQNCRDKQGLQLILIEGNPCQTKTYRILKCLSKIKQDDVFVQLDSLKPQTKYLLNIDGFLGDVCEFGIQLADKPNGMPLVFANTDTVEARVDRKGRHVQLNWIVDEKKIDELEYFKIYRTTKNNVKSQFITELPISRNSYGAYVLNYSASDSLFQEGTYYYRVMGIQKQTQIPFLLVDRIVEYFEPQAKPKPQRTITLQLAFRDRQPFKVLIYDDSQKLLAKQMVVFDKKIHTPLEIDLGDFLDQGIRKFMVLVHDADDPEALEFYYRVNELDQLIRE